MGAVGAWIRFFAGMFIIAAAVIFMEPTYGMLDAAAVAGNVSAAHPTLAFIRNARQYALIFVGIALMLSAFLGSTTTESGGYYR